MTGNGKATQRLARAEYLAARAPELITAGQFTTFLHSLQRELEALLPRERHGEIPSALTRAAASVGEDD